MLGSALKHGALRDQECPTFRTPRKGRSRRSLHAKGAPPTWKYLIARVNLRRVRDTAKPEPVHYIFLFLVQFPWPAAFDGKNVPSSPVRHGAFRRFEESWMCMQTAAMTPTLGPSRFIPRIQKPKAYAQRSHYFGNHDGYLFSHRCQPMFCLY